MTDQCRKGDFESWMTKHRIRSTMILLAGMWMSIDAYQWAKEFASSSIRPGVEIAGIILAVQGIATSFTVWAFGIYSRNKTP